MATRLYLPSAGEAEVDVPRANLWTHIGQNNVSLPMVTERTNTPELTVANGVGAQSGIAQLLQRKYVSPRLAAQSYSGVFRMVRTGWQSTLNGNACMQAVLRVVSEDGQTIKRTIWAGVTHAVDTTQGENYQRLHTEARSRVMNMSASGGTFAAGDRLELELGAKLDSPSATVNIYGVFRDDLGADFDFTYGISAAANPWFETDDNLVFLGDMPAADAGADQTVLTGAQVSLAGSGTHPSGVPITGYSWRVASQPVGSAVTLSGSSTANASFTPSVAGTYVLALSVTDANGTSSAEDTVTVTATAAPTVDVARTVDHFIDARGSSGTGLTFAIEQVLGPAVTPVQVAPGYWRISLAAPVTEARIYEVSITTGGGLTSTARVPIHGESPVVHRVRDGGTWI